LQAWGFLSRERDSNGWQLKRDLAIGLQVQGSNASERHCGLALARIQPMRGIGAARTDLAHKARTDVNPFTIADDLVCVFALAHR